MSSKISWNTKCSVKSLSSKVTYVSQNLVFEALKHVWNSRNLKPQSSQSLFCNVFAYYQARFWCCRAFADHSDGEITADGHKDSADYNANPFWHHVRWQAGGYVIVVEMGGVYSRSGGQPLSSIQIQGQLAKHEENSANDINAIKYHVFKSKKDWVACTGLPYKAVPRFGEFCCWCCLKLLPQLACGILATWEQP